MSLLDLEIFPRRGRVLGRVVAVGCCPRCGPEQSVTITQPAIAWNDERETDPVDYGPLEMECGRCGASIEDVEFPLEPSKWQFLLETKKPTKKVLEMPSRRRGVKAS